MTITEQEMRLRLSRLETEQSLKNIMSQYMHLCDDLSSLAVTEQISQLFTEDAVWEGIGELYKHKLGKYQGRQAIQQMMQSYVRTPSHFAINVHFLCSENTEVISPESACGRWKMLQTSTFSHGCSHLNCAELIVTFSLINNKWLINHFTTRNLFSRPIDYLNSDKDLPVPDINSQ